MRREIAYLIILLAFLALAGLLVRRRRKPSFGERRSLRIDLFGRDGGKEK
jgi:LPXTG-motif cell wall-anchored protein